VIWKRFFSCLYIADFDKQWYKGLFFTVFENVTLEMIKNLMKMTKPISFDDAKKFYLEKENSEKEFLDFTLLLGFKNSDYDTEVRLSRFI